MTHRPEPGARTSGNPPASEPRPGARQPAPTPRLDIEAIVAAAGHTSYQWDLRSDEINWQTNAPAVLDVGSLQHVASGAAYHMMIATEHSGARFDLIRNSKVIDAGQGVAYRLRYRFLPDGRRGARGFWLEDEGRWFAGRDGAPGSAMGVLRRVDDQLAGEQRLLYLSERDHLTGLMNSSRLVGAIESAFAEERATGKPFAFMIASIDNLSRINETFGFEIGNEVIREVAATLKQQLRGCDEIGRFSSNKFGAIVHDCDTNGVQAVARRMLEAVGCEAITTSACRIAVTVAIGAVLAPRHAATMQEVLGNALDAHEEAKSRRGNGFQAYAPSAARISSRKQNIAMTDGIIEALDEDRIRLALQPIVRADTLQPAFSECLLRMQMPDGSIVTAGEFMPIAEQLGLARLLDLRVLQLAVEHLRANPSAHLSFNVSGQTAGDHEWLVTLHRLTGGDRSLTSRMIVEITETAAIEELEECRGLVDALKDLGCRVAIDDFGAGYTTFKNLRHLGAHIVKIDGSFIRNLGRDAADRVFVEALVRLARHFDMETVAEFVSNDQSIAILRKAGVTYLQGNHLGPATLVSSSAGSRS